MPIYVYECQQCGERFEYSQSLSEPKKTVCEKCAGPLEKIIAPTSFHLKGGGWYKDLYAKPKSGSSGSSGSSESSGSSGSSGSEAKTETKTEAKSEAKTETKSESKPSGGGDK